jgi:hypothetical protein
VRNDLVRLRGNRLDAHQLEAEVEWRLRDRREQFAGYRESVRKAEAESRASHPPQPDPATRADLKSLYRDLAKRAHPDLATDAADRAARGALMADINAAYARFDLSVLKAIRARLTASATSADRSADRDWLRAEIDRLDRLIVTLRADIADYNRSDWMVMKLDAALARSRGLDWFAQARRQIEARLAERRRELQHLIEEFKELVRAVGLA